MRAAAGNVESAARKFAKADLVCALQNNIFCPLSSKLSDCELCQHCNLSADVVLVGFLMIESRSVLRAIRA